MCFLSGCTYGMATWAAGPGTWDVPLGWLSGGKESSESVSVEREGKTMEKSICLGERRKHLQQ